MALDLPVPSASVPLRLARIIVISALIACIVAAWVLFVQMFAPNWDGGYLIVLAALGAFQTLLAEPFIRPFDVSHTNRLQVRLADLGILLVLVKLAPSLGRGWDSFWADVGTWLGNPGTLLSAEFVWGGLLVAVVWFVAIDIAEGLEGLADASDPQSQSIGMAEIKSDFVVGAYLLLIAVGLRHVITVLAHLDLSPEQANLQLALPLVYVGLGLALFGQARLALLTASWRRENVPVDARLGGRWGLWGALLVLGVGILALLMPAGNTIAGFYVLTWLGQVLGVFAQFVLAILAFLVALIVSPCLALFQIQQGQQAPPPTPAPPVQPPPPAAIPDWLLALRSFLFWGALLLVLLFLIRIYLEDREGLFSGALFQRLVNWWRAFWASLRQGYQQFAVRLARPRLRRAPGPPESETSWWDRWRARTARERVRRLYLVLLQRAAKSGYPRSPGQTPFEYVARLEPQLPAEQESLEQLTDAFVRARYSRADFTTEEVGLLHRLWERLQKVLRRIR